MLDGILYNVDAKVASSGCAFGQGLALILSGCDLKIMSTFVKLFTDITKAELSTRHVKTVTDLFFNAKNKKIPLKQLTKAVISISKTALLFITKRLGTSNLVVSILKKNNIFLAYAKFAMDAIEIATNYKKYFKDGVTRENVLKFSCAITYQIFINTVFSVLKNASSLWIIGGVSIALASYRLFLEKNGILPVVKVGESFDRLFFGKEPDKITKIYMQVLGIMTCLHATYSIIKMVNADVPEHEQKTIEQITRNEFDQIKIRENDIEKIKQNALPCEH